MNQYLRPSKTINLKLSPSSKIFRNENKIIHASIFDPNSAP